MRIHFKSILFCCSLLLLTLIGCSINDNPELDHRVEEKGEITRLSPFDSRLMDLTAFLISADKALMEGEEKGLNYGDLMWGNGYAYATNEREYTRVPFKPGATFSDAL